MSATTDTLSTTATATQTKYTTIVTGKPAPRDRNNNPMIDIRLNHVNRQAIFDCANDEHVGDHKQRKVRFTASDDCTLHFMDKAIFGRENIDLFKNKPEWLPVADTVTNASTVYAVTPNVQTTEKTVISPMVPPRIVVP